MAQQRNDSLTARSVLASALLGVDPPELPVSYLVRLSGLFDVNENRARVALSRMVAAERSPRTERAITACRGTCSIASVARWPARPDGRGPGAGTGTSWWSPRTGSPPEVRNRRRRSLSLARLAELREGVWLRPDNLDLVLPEEVDLDVLHLRSRVDDDAALMRRLWEPERRAAGADELITLLDRHPPNDWADLAPCFEIGAAVVRHFQADPLLPRQLLPASWPGERLRRTYDEWYRRYRRLLAAWSRSARRPATGSPR